MTVNREDVPVAQFLFGSVHPLRLVPGDVLRLCHPLLGRQTERRDRIRSGPDVQVPLPFHGAVQREGGQLQKRRIQCFRRRRRTDGLGQRRREAAQSRGKSFIHFGLYCSKVSIQTLL